MKRDEVVVIDKFGWYDTINEGNCKSYPIHMIKTVNEGISFRRIYKQWHFEDIYVIMVNDHHILQLYIQQQKVLPMLLQWFLLWFKHTRAFAPTHSAACTHM